MALQTDARGFTKADERRAIEASAWTLGAIKVGEYIKRQIAANTGDYLNRRNSDTETYYLLTAWGFKRVRYITPSYDCVTNPGSSYIDQQTYAVHGDIYLYPATELRKYSLL